MSNFEDVITASRNSDDADHASFRFYGLQVQVAWSRHLGKLVETIRSSPAFHDLSFGPIDPPEASLRAKWAENELGRTGWHEVIGTSERVWDEARFPDNRKVAWLTRRSAKEYAGFLELWRLGDAPCEVVDLTDVKISYRPELDPPRPPALAMSLGTLHHDTICNNKLWDLAEPLQIAQRGRYLDLWQQLRSENAPLRVIDGDKLVSAPIFRFTADVLRNEPLAKGFEGRWLCFGVPNGRLHLSDLRYCSGGSHQLSR